MESRKSNWGVLATVAGLALATTARAEVDPNFYVFLAFGQSNMEGNAAVPSPAPTYSARFQNLSAVTCGSRTQGKWATATSPIIRCDTKYCPLDYFGKTMTDSLPSNIKVGVVGVAVAGTAITGFDPTGYSAYYSSAASWMQSIANQYGGNPYKRLIDMAKVAQQTGVIKGILLHQGETDAFQSGWADKVKKIYDQMLTDLSLKATDVPLLAGEVYSNAGTNAGIDGLPKVIPTAYVISSSGCTAGSDNLHFTVAGYQTLGTRYAQKMLSLLPKQTPSGIAAPVAPVVTASADYAVFDIRGTRVAGFQAQDAAAVESQWNGLRSSLPRGVYWIKGMGTESARKVVNGR